MSIRVLSLSLPCLIACSQASSPETPDAAKSVDARSSDGSSTAAAPPVLNEIMRKPPKDATADLEIHEFVEIHGDPSTDYSAFAVLQVRGQGDPGEPGQIRTVHVLGTTDAKGLWSTGYLMDQLKNNSETFLLVEGFTGAADDDLDTNDDGMLDVQPWARIVDAIALEDDSAEGPTHFKYATLVLTPGLDGNPDEFEGVSRKVDGADTDTAADWARNDPDGAGLPGVMGTPVMGEAISTMGAPNQLATSSGTSAKLNDFVFNHAGADTAEYVELKGAPGGDLSSLTIVVLEGDLGATGGAGVIDAVLAAGTANAAGYYVTAMLANAFENGSQTVLLVSGFSGAVATDLDTDDDGMLDVMPWTAILDAVAVRDLDVADVTYAGTATLPATFDGGTLPVGGASRIPDGLDTDAATDWRRNDFEGEGLPFGMAGTTMAGEAVNTPGAPNQAP